MLELEQALIALLAAADHVRREDEAVLVAPARAHGRRRREREPRIEATAPLGVTAIGSSPIGDRGAATSDAREQPSHDRRRK